MQNVILVVHLIIAVCLIAVVLLQRSEGGALGIGGGGGNMTSSRGSMTALSKVTWALATAFLTTSITLAILAGGAPTSQSIITGSDAPEDGIILPDLPPAADDGLGGGAGAPAPAVVLPDLGGDPAPQTPPSAD